MSHESGAVDPSGLSGRSISHFRVLQPLGAGGMGVVYRAEDVTLGRTVALKFMLPDYTIDDTAAARFLREARSVAALDHPNICTVHEAGRSEEGHLFLAMSYYDGETLKDRLTNGSPIPVEQALDIAAQVARGLVCAHGAGIVHRDLKPANVMLTADGTVKILDFGLAKARDQTMTASGIVMGTVAYMSPEQLLGEPVDARSDLWSLGVMLVEMLTGKHPSAVDDATATLGRRIEARHPGVMRPQRIRAVAQLVDRLLKRDPGDRYQTAADVVVELSVLAEPVAGAAGAQRRPPVRPWTRLALGIAAAAVLIAATVGVLRWAQRDRSPNASAPGPAASNTRTSSLAVLPLKNYGKPNEEFFARGMTDELTSTLTKIAALRVTARQSVLQFEHSTVPVPEIARILGVKFLVDGSVRQDSTHVEITASLIDAARNTSVWSDVFERDRRNVMALQREVALAIAQAIQVTLTPQDRTRLAPAREPDPAAMDLYIKGTQARYEANTTGNFRAAMPYLKAAIVKDTAYAAPYAGLASLYASTDDETNARVFVEKALSLDPKLAEAHMVRGMIRQYFAWDLAGADRSFRDAIDINPSFAEAHHELSMLLSRMKRFEEALREGQQAVLLAPTSLRFINGIGEVLLAAGREAEALKVADEVLAKDSTFVNGYQIRGTAYRQLEQWDEATKAWIACGRVTPGSCHEDAELGYIYARTGRLPEATKVLRKLEARVAEQDPSGNAGSVGFELAMVHMGLGDRAQVLTLLERATEAHSGFVLYLAVERAFAPLRGEPRFQALLTKIGLPTS